MEAFPPADVSHEADLVLERLSRRADAPDPADEHAMLTWAAGHDPQYGGPVTLSRFLVELRAERPDLLDAYPQVPGCDVPEFREWARVFGREQVPLPASLMPEGTPTPSDRYLQAGVNLAGFLTAELGVGEAARRIAHALRAASIPFATTTFDRTANRTAVAFGEDGDPRYDTNLVCVNADSWGAFAQQVGPAFFAGRHTTAVWFWETSIFPSMFHSAFRGIDEIWCASGYVADVIRRAAPPEVPVVEFPMPIVEPPAAPTDMRGALGLPSGRSFIVTSFDYNSVAERKNPRGTIEAFRRAFPHGDGPVLVVKSINGHRHPADVGALHDLVGRHDDVLLHDGYLTAEDNAALLKQADAFVSLHRAEGFGFNIADAMALGTPVITTAYSGNLTFTTSSDCRHVPAHEIAVGPGQFPYPADAMWGDPDLDAAARAMADLVVDPERSRALAAHARDRVLSTFTPARTGTFIRNRFAASRMAREQRVTAERVAAEAAMSMPVEGLGRRIARRLR